MMMRPCVPTLRVGPVTSNILPRTRSAFLTQVISDVCDSARRKGMVKLTIKTSFKTFAFLLLTIEPALLPLLLSQKPN